MMKYFLFIAFFILIVSCNQEHHEISRSFYYWKTNVDIDSTEQNALQQLQIEKLFVKFFDVTWKDQQPVPVADVAFNGNNSYMDKVEIVPVIFITNETMQKINQNDCATLAFKISKHIEYLLQQNHLDAPKEIQLDCDWNESTEGKYFNLITELKKYPGWQQIQWSATVRLHQVKYREQTGVPPVDRGMLMFYNMGNIEDASSSNSIFDKHIAEQYTQRIRDYPLPLDAGIACFSWGLLFDGGKLLKIIYPLYPSELPDSLFQSAGGNRFIAKDNFYFRGSFLVTGNSIRLETMTPDLSRESAELLSENLKNEKRSVILYHLDPVIIQSYDISQFNSLYTAFE